MGSVKFTLNGIIMRDNWIEDVILDLSKSALKQGRLRLYRALRDVANTAEIKYEDATHSKLSAKTSTEQTAQIFDFYEHLYAKQNKLN